MTIKESNNSVIRQNIALAIRYIARTRIGFDALIAALIEIEGGVDVLVSMSRQEDNTSNGEINISFVLAQIAQREDGIFRRIGKKTIKLALRKILHPSI